MKSISIEELKSKLDSGENVNLLDVREPDERAEFNIGGVHIPLSDIQSMQTDPIDGWKDQEVIIYCRSGNRSGMAGLYLEQMGFQKVKNLTGGTLEWQSKYGK